MRICITRQPDTLSRRYTTIPKVFFVPYSVPLQLERTAGKTLEESTLFYSCDSALSGDSISRCRIPDGSTSPTTIVIENAATWHSYCRWNAEAQVFSGVVYGDGNRFADGIRCLPDILAARAACSTSETSIPKVCLSRKKLRRALKPLAFLLSSRIFGTIASCSNSGTATVKHGMTNHPQQPSAMGCANALSQPLNCSEPASASLKNTSAGNSSKASSGRIEKWVLLFRFSISLPLVILPCYGHPTLHRHSASN